MGIIAVNQSVTTPGTPVKLYQPDATHPVLRVNDIQVQADPSNAGKVYIGLQGMVKGTTPATRRNVLAVLSAGDQWPEGGGFCGANPEYLYVDADTEGDGVNAAVAG